jgi:SAM-dependent methyltransferase
MAGERNRLRTTFDEAASLYDEVRPGYPGDLFDDVVSLSGIPSGGRILEIGCGTGQATLPFARRGYRILCIELGENMAAVARRNLEGYPHAEVRAGAFEESSLQEGSFDLAISATAFHWLDPAIAYPKAAATLRDGGSLALFWNVHVHSDPSEEFFEAAQRGYMSTKRRRSSGRKTTRGFPDPTKSLTGRRRSRTQASSAVLPPAITGGI